MKFTKTKIAKYIALGAISIGGFSCATMSGTVDGVSSEQMRKLRVPQYADNGRGRLQPAILEGKTMEEAKQILGKNPVFQGVKRTPAGQVGILVYSAKQDLRVNYNLNKLKKCNYLFFYEKNGMKYKYNSNAGRPAGTSGGSNCNLGSFNEYQTIFPK